MIQQLIDFDAVATKPSRKQRKAAVKASKVQRVEITHDNHQLVAEISKDSVTISGKRQAGYNNDYDNIPSDLRMLIEAVDSWEGVLVTCDYIEEYLGDGSEADRIRKRVESGKHKEEHWGREPERNFDHWSKIQNYLRGHFTSEFKTPIYEDYSETWNIGDRIITGSYNLIYTDPIHKITKSGVWYVKTGYGSTASGKPKTARMNWRQFFGRNCQVDWERVDRRNLETSYTI